MAIKQETWQGGVCKGLVVDSEEARQRLREAYGEDHLEVDERSLEEIQEEELDFFDWLMLG